MRISLSRQLLLVGMITVAVLAVAIVLTAIRVNSLRQQVTTLEAGQQSVTLLLAIKATALSVSRADPILPETKEQLAQADRRIEADAKQLAAMLDAQAGKQITSQVMPQWRDYLKQFQSALAIAETSPQDALSIPEQIFKLNLEPAVQVLDQLVSKQVKQATALKQVIDQQMSRIVTEVIVVLLLAAGTVVASQMFFARRLNRQVGNTAAIASRLAQGELSLRLPETQDELGQISSAINRFIDQLNTLLGEVTKASTLVTEQALQLGNTASEVRENTHLQSEDVAKIGAAMEQMSTSIDSVSAFTQGAAEKSSQSVDLVSSVAGKTQEAMDEMHALADDIDQTSGMLSELNRSVTEVTQVSELIKGIASQTNLLALNAAIEAARAGEAGRGFAVVADEVRSLSERTSEATASINRQLSQLATSMESSREAMQRAREKVRTEATQIESVATLSTSVSEAVREVEALMRNIADTTIQQSQGAAEIAREVATINELAEKNVVAIEKTNADIQTLGTTANTLDQAARQFTLR